MYWGGLRGAISLALVLSLPATLGGGGQLLAMVFGLVLFTLLIQGTSMSTIVEKLKIITRTPDQDEYDLRRTIASSTRTSYDYLEKVYKAGMISKHVWEIMSGALDPYNKQLTSEMKDMLKNRPDVETEELDSAWREFLSHQRLVVAEHLAVHSITEDTYSVLVSQIDNALDQPEIKWDSLEDLNNIFEKQTGPSETASA